MVSNATDVLTPRRTKVSSRWAKAVTVLVFLGLAAGNAAIAVSKIGAGVSEAWVFLVSFAGLCVTAVRTAKEDCAPAGTLRRMSDLGYSLLMSAAAGLLVATGRPEAVLSVMAYGLLLWGATAPGHWLLAAFYALGLHRVAARPATLAAHSFATGFYALKASRVI